MATTSVTLGPAALLGLPFWVAAIGWLSGRVLGVRIGRWRSAVAASIGWFLGLVGAAAVLSPDTDGPAVLIPVVVFFGVLATLPVAIVLDLVLRRHPHRAGRRCRG